MSTVRTVGIFREDFHFWPRSNTKQLNYSAPSLKTTMSSPDEENLSQLTASTRQSFFSAATTTTTTSDTPNYLTSFKDSGHELISPFTVNPLLRAAAWKCFHYYKQNMTRACCNQCGKTIKVQNGISGLTSHLQRSHPGVLEKVTPGVIEKVNSADKDSRGGKRKNAPAGAEQRSIMSFCAPVLTEEDLQEKIKGYACEWLLEDMLPTSIAESKPFRKFLQRVISTTGGNKVIQPMNKLSRQGCDSWIEQKEITMRKKLISETEGQVLCLTIDHWTSRGKQSYTGMTCH
jgi:hypothetical protein